MSAAPDRYEELLERARRKHRPLTVQWELTAACNLRCRHCYLRPSGGEELSTAEACRVLDQLADAGVLYLVLTGGEILARPDFFALAGRARELGFALRLLTNGTLVDGAAADRIAALRPLSVEISLYGAGAGVHDRVTGAPGSFAAALDAMRALAGRGLAVQAKYPLMKDNAAQFAAARDLAVAAGAGFAWDPVLVPADDGDRAPLAHALDEGEHAAFLAAHAPDAAPDPAARPEEQLLCNAGLDTACISPAGLVHPCVALKGVVAGDLRRQSFADIWRSPELARLRAVGLGDLAGCRGCRLVSWCDRCAGLALAEAGDLAAPSATACSLARARKSASERSACPASTNA